MDDRELEVRLRSHLHQRFDDASPSPELNAAVQQVFGTELRGFPLPKLRLGALSLSWSVLGVVALVAALAIAAIRFERLPAAPGASPTPLPTVETIREREFIVLAPAGTPTPVDRDRATQVFLDRLARVGLKGTSSERLDVIVVTLELEGPPDDVIGRILAASGDVAFVPLPETYNDGTLVAEVGKPLPSDDPALFGWDGIASVNTTFDQQNREVLSIDLRPDAAAAFGAYTTSHVGETFAILIDGEVVSLPTINEPILGGAVQVSDGGPEGEFDRFDEAVAILLGGMLPQAWQGADVLKILTREDAIEATRASGQGGGRSIEGADLDVFETDAGLQPVWRVTLSGGAVVTIDALTGEWLSTGIFDQPG